MTGHEILKRFNAMDDNVRQNWMNLWQECADWAWPQNDNINEVRIGGQEKNPQRMIDTCIEANFNFASGFFSHMFPPGAIWAKFRHPNPEVMEKAEIAEYFEEVSRRIHQTLIDSNFAQEEFQALLSMGTFGTNCLAVEEDDSRIVRFRNYIISKIRIDENHLGEIDTVGLELDLTPRQAIQKFTKEALIKAELSHIVSDAETFKDTKHKFIHFVCPRVDYDKGKKDVTNKPFASFYVSKDNSKIVLETGFDYNPYKVARFSTGNDEIYGTGPMRMKLGTARRTNVIYRSTILSAEQHANGQWLVPDDDSVKGLSGRAGAIIKWRSTNPNGKPERLSPNGDPGISMDMFKMHEDEIKRMFFNHLFRPLEDYRNMTAFEVNERMTSDMMVLTPFTSRYNQEHVSQIMVHVYYILQKKNLLPPIPEGLDNNFEIDYVGKLSLATKNFETMGSINTLRIFGELSQMNPQMLESLDYVDNDALLHDIWFNQSASMTSLKSEDDVEKIRDTRRQQQQQQQQIDNMAPMADAAQKMSGAVDPQSIIAKMQGG